MRGKVSRKLRKIAQKETIGQSEKMTRVMYQDLKTMFKNGDVSVK